MTTADATTPLSSDVPVSFTAADVRLGLQEPNDALVNGSSPGQETESNAACSCSDVDIEGQAQNSQRQSDEGVRSSLEISCASSRQPLQQPRLRQRRLSQAIGDFGGSCFIFFVLIATSSMVNFDSGGTAAILVSLSKGCPEESLRTYGQPPQIQSYDPGYPCLTQDFKGYLGAAPYIGLVCGCPLMGFLLDRWSEKMVLVVFMLLNAAATFLFAYQSDKWCMLAAKFVIGLTQGSISIYAPVWVSTFAPAANKTLWYGLMQSAAAIGNLIGYAVCGYLNSIKVFYQWGFRIQAFYLVFATIVLYLIPRNRIDASSIEETASIEEIARAAANSGTPLSGGSHRHHHNHRMSVQSIVPIFDPEEEPEPAPDSSPITAIFAPLKLLAIPLYVTTLFAICSLYFVVTAIQYWASEFFIKAYMRPEGEVTTVFVIVSATAPILGVVVGSSITDRLGGTGSPEQVAKICRVTFIWAVIASVAGGFAGLVPVVQPGEDSTDCTIRFYLCVVGIWVQLFFGGAMLPSISGISLESISVKNRAMGSSLSMLFQNIFGFCLGVYIPGAISSHEGDMVLAMQFSLCWALWGCIGMAAAVFFSSRQAKAAQLAREVEGTAVA
mmetsp:Transcript_73821/g.161506  ORF Transcript_73821/g.161506 Transcript_73821/m.161506 type:complete len:611 (+) Transcript_73821:624-2456(+)